MTGSGPVMGVQSKADDFVPVEQASFHQLIFADEDIAVLNNLYPPSGDSGFHAHYRDLFAVIIQPSESSGQPLGKPLTKGPVNKKGDVAFSPVGEQRRIHRIVNGGKGIFQIIVVELRRAAPVGDEVSSREGAPQYVRIVDNPRMRAWRLILEPGRTAPAISQGGKGVRVVVRGGLLKTITPGIADQTLMLQPGEFSVQPAGSTRALSNVGPETIELVEMELK
ncbi:MAG: hypothetical protein IBJ12_16075 [Sphingomonadaceae bacterium]|nr:hypothetical protein [Sphingomonadaceae bacterium]